MWDLRCEVKTVLETSSGTTEAPVRSDTLQKILDVMREHVHHRKTQRNLKKEAKVSLRRIPVHCMHIICTAAACRVVWNAAFGP